MAKRAPDAAPSGSRWLTPSVLGIGAASFFADVGYEATTALLPSLLVSTPGAPAAVLGMIEGISDLLAGLARISTVAAPGLVHRDRTGHIRVIEAEMPYERLAAGAFDKVRQAGRGMPAVTIRQLEALARIMEFAVDERQRCALLRQADMLLRSSEEAIPEPNDRPAARERHGAVVATMRGARRGAFR